MSDEPSLKDLPEIGKRLCALIGAVPAQPVNAFALRRVHDDHFHLVPPQRHGVLHALSICADALARHEQPPEVRALRDLIDEFAAASQRTGKLQEALLAATKAAIPVLDAEAEVRGAAQAAALTVEEAAIGLTANIWPSPASLSTFPRALLVVIPRQRYIVQWLQKVLHDLPRLRADPRVVGVLAPTNIRMAKALKAAGLEPGEIATVIKPFERRGRGRAQARNTVLRYLKAKSEDQMYPTYDGVADQGQLEGAYVRHEAAADQRVPAWRRSGSKSRQRKYRKVVVSSLASCIARCRAKRR
ncbi:MAG: hypothetical protein SFV15_24045, partial [Polyangiaceae bacterium]|nr:hypothetical protein [Polyangiaceae bacterium]